MFKYRQTEHKGSLRLSGNWCKTLRKAKQTDEAFWGGIVLLFSSKYIFLHNTVILRIEHLGRTKPNGRHYLHYILLLWGLYSFFWKQSHSPVSHAHDVSNIQTDGFCLYFKYSKFKKSTWHSEKNCFVLVVNGLVSLCVCVFIKCDEFMTKMCNSSTFAVFLFISKSNSWVLVDGGARATLLRDGYTNMVNGDSFPVIQTMWYETT